MARVVIIGNGFDLDCGLPTRYVDFLKFAALAVMLEDEGEQCRRHIADVGADSFAERNRMDARIIEALLSAPARGGCVAYGERHAPWAARGRYQ